MALRMDEKSTPREEPNLPRVHFHLTLALILLLPANVIVGWVLAIIDVLKGYSSRAQLSWMRLLVALVVVDALVLASFLWLGTRMDELQKKGAAASARPSIGISLEADGLRIAETVPGMPADRAGIHAGDVIERVDETTVSTAKSFVEVLQSQPAGVPRTLTVNRGGTSVAVPVTPEAPPVPGAKGLFEVEKTGPVPIVDDTVTGMLPGILLVGILAAVARWRSLEKIAVWSGFLLALIGAMGGLLGFLVLSQRLSGGLSLGHFLIGIMVQSVAMFLLTWAAQRWLSREAPEIPTTLAPLRAGLQGCFYLIAGMVRLGILALTAALWLFPDSPLGDPLVAQLSEASFGAAGAILLFIGIAVLGPIAEETLFRGYLLPRLVAQWGELPALFSSSLLFAILHLRDGPFIPIIFFYGWIFGWARLRSGSIVASTALHMAVNGVAAAGILLKS